MPGLIMTEVSDSDPGASQKDLRRSKSSLESDFCERSNPLQVTGLRPQVSCDPYKVGWFRGVGSRTVSERVHPALQMLLSPSASRIWSVQLGKPGVLKVNPALGG